jgi:hypothetical protein
MDEATSTAVAADADSHGRSISASQIRLTGTSTSSRAASEMVVPAAGRLLVRVLVPCVRRRDGVGRETRTAVLCCEISSRQSRSGCPRSARGGSAVPVSSDEVLDDLLVLRRSNTPADLLRVWVLPVENTTCYNDTDGHGSQS